MCLTLIQKAIQQAHITTQGCAVDGSNGVAQWSPLLDIHHMAPYVAVAPVRQPVAASNKV